MTAYYNEIEPAAAHVLECLIKDGVIADGVVDTRSITEVEPGDVSGFAQAHFFAGGGLWSVAARLAGWPDDRPMWTGSCPCQPFSVAGKGAGTGDPRHLWPHFFRLIRSCRPAVVMGEQVAGKSGYGWFDGVRADLEGEGYASRAVDIPACAVNAPHIRQRLYWVAQDLGVSNGAGRDARQQAAASVGHWDTSVAGSDHSDGPVGNTNGAELTSRNVFGSGAETRPECAAQSSSHGMAHADSSERRTAAEGRRDVFDGTDAGREEAPSGRELRSAAVGGDVVNANGRDAIAEGLQRSGIDGLQPEDRCDRRHSDDEQRATFWDDAEWATGADGKTRRVKPGVRLLVDARECVGRVGLLRIGGNAIVAPLAAEVIKALMDTEQ